MFGISLTSKQIYVQAKQSMDIDTFLFIIILNIKGQLFKQSLASVQQNCILSHFHFTKCFYLNPFAPEPPVRIQVLSTLCDVISFNGQGQFSSLTCAEWRDLSNHTRMSTIQSRTPEKEAKNHETLTWKSPWKSCSITHLPFLSPNPKILKAFLKTLPTKLKPTKCPAREKTNEARKAKKEGRRESEK